MKLEVGKRYVMRNGAVTGPLRLYEKTGKWLCDDRSAITWLANGGHWRDADTVNARDIVAEYVEPEPQQPLRWVENCKPDKPGIWAWQYTDWNNIINISGIISPGDLVHAASNGVRWCYLGPIPEILPPKKKVVQRLWVLPDKGRADQVGLLRWFDDPADVMAAGWIRTDATREVEQ